MAVNYRSVLCRIIIGLLILSILIVPLSADEGDNEEFPILGNQPGNQNDVWSQFLGNPAKTGNTTANGPGYYYELWNVAANAVWGSPVIMYDQIYLIGSATRCYNMSGGLLWSFSASSSYSSPLVFNGRVYVSSTSGNLYCLAANATGSGTTTNHWTYRPSSASNSAGSPVTDGKMVYYSTQSASGLHAVWITNGTKAWNASLGGSTATESSPAYWQGKVYCGGGYSWGGGSDDLFCFNATSGELIWKFTTGDDITSTPVIEYGRVYFGSMDGKVYCVDAEGNNGSTTKYWEYNTNSATYGVYSSPAVAYGRVYIGATNSRLYCLDAYGSGGSTTVYWQQTLGPSAPMGVSGIVASATATPNYVYVGTSGNGMHCRNRSTGAEEWSKTLTSATYGLSSPALYKDICIMTSDNGRIYAFGLDTVLPKIISSTPEDNDVDIDMYDNISVKFDEDMDKSLLTNANINLKDSGQNNVPGEITSDMNIDTIYFDPDQPLKKDETYTFTITSDIKDSHGNNLDGNGNGVVDGSGVDDFVISFTTIPFYPPKIGALAIPKLTEDVPYTTNISSLITDDDTPKYTLNLTEDSDYVTLTGFELKFLYPEGVTSDLLNLTVNDGLFTVWKEIPITIEPVNDLPIISTIPKITATEDITYNIDMKDYIFDVDTPLSELRLYVFSENYASKLGYIDVEDLSINLTYPNGVLSDTINVTVYEGDLSEGQSDLVAIEVEVTPVNDKPELDEPISEITMKEDDIDTSISLVEWFKDIDDDKLNYTSTGEENVIITINTAGGVTIEPNEDWNGQENVTFTATDSGLLSESSILIIKVEGVNDAPVIDSITSPDDSEVFESDETIDLNAIVTDADLIYGDKLSYYWESSEDGGIGYEQSVSDITLEPGTHVITLTVTDRASATATMDVTITVNKPEVPDTDNDGITDDLDDDDDNDGISDVWENKYPSILDPLDPTDAALDSDSDGYTNLQEYLGADGEPGGNDESNPLSKTSTPTKDTKEDDDGDDSGSDNSFMMFALIGIVIVVVLLVLVFMFMRKRKKSDEEAPGEGQPPAGDASQPVPIQTTVDEQILQQQQMPMQQMPMQMPMDQQQQQMMMGAGVGVQPYQTQPGMYDQMQMPMTMEQQPSYPPQMQYQDQQQEQMEMGLYGETYIPPTENVDGEVPPIDQIDSQSNEPTIESQLPEETDEADLLSGASVFSLPPAEETEGLDQDDQESEESEESEETKEKQDDEVQE
jgi:outer membrane protein assembly factor BamB